MNSGQFITDIVVVSGKDKCPPGYTIVSTFYDSNILVSKILGLFVSFCVF